MSSFKMEVVAACIATAAFAPGLAWGSFAPGDDGRRPTGPPPEAYEACAGKSAGATVEISTPRGTVTATCRQVGDRLAAVPRRDDGAPPEGAPRKDDTGDTPGAMAPSEAGSRE